jgi:hypothetical protein
MLPNPVYYTSTNVTNIDDPGWQYLTPNLIPTKIVRNPITIPVLKLEMAVFRPNLAFSLALHHIGLILLCYPKSWPYFSNGIMQNIFLALHKLYVEDELFEIQS